MRSHIKHIQKLIDFIEEHLIHEIKVDDIVSQSPMSKWEVQRVFRRLTGDSIGNYLKKRRLYLAAHDLLSSSNRILDIALKYQFSSQEAFSKAFRKLFRQSPSELRKRKYQLSNLLIAKPQITEEMLFFLNQNIEFEAKLINLEEKKIIGVSCEIPSFFKNKKIPKGLIFSIWDQLNESKHLIKNIVNPHLSYGIAISELKDNTDSTFRYLAGFEVSDLIDIPEKFETYILTSQKYAVFKKQSACDESYLAIQYIYGIWLEQSHFQRAQGDDFQVFDETKLGNEIGQYSWLSDYYLPIQTIFDE